jgi:predicted nucleic acid-binding protein
MRFLDTDVMIDILRGHPPALQWLKSLGGEEIGLCGIVVMELIQGCQNQGEIRKLEKIY